MRIAIMQPYFMPYIGYFQLINAVDEFVVYDNIEYTKKGWINRNRILVNGKNDYITLPVKNASDFLDVRERFLSDSWMEDRKKMLNKIKEAYRKAPYFTDVFALLEKCILFDEENLFQFILNSLNEIKNYLEIPTSFVKASTIPINHELKSEQKLIEICKARNAKIYINPIGGTELYRKKSFSDEGIKLQFIQAQDVNYTQFKNPFVPWLSIIDVMMFNNTKETQIFLNNNYSLN